MGGVRAGCGLSTCPDPRRAAEEAAGAALEGAGGRAESALLFATPAWGEGLPALLDAAVGVLGTEVVVGASAHGVLAAGRDSEEGTAVAVLAQAGLEAQPFLLQDAAGDEAGAAEEIAARLGGGGGAGAAGPLDRDLVVLLPDPGAVDAGALVQATRAALGDARVVGAGAAHAAGAPPLQWCGRRLESGALAGLALRAPTPPRIGVTQACRPASELLTVTLARANWVLELDGRPALDVYREVARGPLAADLERAAAYVLVALPGDPGSPDALSPGHYRVRHVVGFAPEQRAFALPELARNGQRLALALREPEAAREDLKAMLAGLAGPEPAFGLYFNCCARGRALFGIPGLEAGYLESAFGRVPIAGPFGSCEIGPAAGRSELLTYTGVLALVDA